MGASDIAVLQFVFAFGLPLGALLLILLIVGQRVNRFKSRLTSSLLLRLEQVYDQLSESHLRSLLAELHSTKSQDWYLANRGLIRILVINLKTGEILKYLPKNAHLVVVDRNAYVCQFLQSDLGRRRLDHLHVEQVVVEHAENMSQVVSNSVDAVVATRVLCSSRNVSRALAEIQRVLAPGGKYFFVEHTHERHPYSKLGVLQTLLTRLRVWPLLTHNCHLSRLPEAAIRKAPKLEHLHLEYVQLSVDEGECEGKRDSESWISRLFRLKPLYIFGHCTKSCKPQKDAIPHR